MAARPDAERLAVWRSFLEVHARILRSLESELQAERALPLGWYDVLVQLQEAGGRLRMSELADRCLVNRSSLTRLIDRMADAELVAREPSPDDGRGWYAALTSTGRSTLRAAAPTHLRGVQKHFARHLTESDVVALQRVLGKLATEE